MVRDMDQFRRDVQASELQFGVNLLQMTSLDKTEVLSPANLSLALTLLRQGTKGETRKMMNEAILAGVCDKHLTTNQIFLQKTLQNAENGVVLEISNKLFIADRIEVKAEYKNDLKKNFEAEAQIMNFGNAAKCVKVISDFITKATHGKIKAEIDEETIRESHTCIVSVLYAKAEWNKPFKVKYTKMEKFTKADGTTKDILFMNGYSDYLYYYKDADVQVLAKKYKDQAYEFVWILPNDPTEKGFEEFRVGLTGKKIQKYLSQLKGQEVNVKVPKMSISCKYDLIEILKHLGLEKLTNHADFTGITHDDFKIRNGSHSTVLEVDEIGTVAAAATVMFASDGMRPPPPRFYANHPFIMLMHKNQHPIMMGHFMGPKEE